MQNDRFLVQLHMHTSETSACARSTGAEMARACKEAGYGLIVVTDHFMNANIGCPRTWSWPDKVDYLFLGYEAARAEGEKIGLTVLFGWETMNNGPEFLTYGLGRDFLLQNPDLADLDANAYLARVRAAGGFVIHAHPFRRARYIPLFTPDPRSVEAFEVWNASHSDRTFDAKALAMAQENGLIQTSGSDAHLECDVRGGAMSFPEPFHTSEALIAALRAGKGQIIKSL